MEIKIAPSLLAADFADLANAVREVEAGGAKYLHFDIMDGHFVPNITFGSMVLQAIRPLTSLRFLVHLMISRPWEFVEEFARAGADSITVHAEVDAPLHQLIKQIKTAGIEAGVALKPATPLSVIERVLGDIDLLLVMTVEPGFGGQDFMEEMLPKIKEARRMVEATGRDIDIAVDGGIDFKTCEQVVRAGANLLVAGTTVFANHLPVAQVVRELEARALSSASDSR